MKPGDKVRCVLPNDNLEENKIYTVREIIRDFVYVDNIKAGFFPERFVLADEQPKTEQICTCSSNQLLWGGCICGAITRNN